MTDYRLPELSGTVDEQLCKLRSYLYQLAQQLQFAADTQSRGAPAPQTPAASGTGNLSGLKSLLIKSADFTESISEETKRKLSGNFVAQSEFGTFSRETEQRIQENAEGVRREFENRQRLTDALNDLKATALCVAACIRTGLLEDTDTPVYGVEIGQADTVDGAAVFRRYARLTADKLSFYSGDDRETAYLGGAALHITRAEAGSLEAADGRFRRLRIGDMAVNAAPDGHITLA